MKQVISVFLAVVLLFLPIAIWTLQPQGEMRGFDFWHDQNQDNLGYLNRLDSSSYYTFADLTQELAIIWKNQDSDQDTNFLKNIGRTTRKISDSLYEIGSMLSSMLNVFGIVIPWYYTIDISGEIFDWGAV